MLANLIYIVEFFEFFNIREYLNHQLIIRNREFIDLLSTTLLPEFLDSIYIVSDNDFADKLEEIRKKYRNQVAHKDEFNQVKYKGLFEAVIGAHDFFAKSEEEQKQIIEDSLLRNAT
jgi:hypothetical protein